MDQPTPPTPSPFDTLEVIPYHDIQETEQVRLHDPMGFEFEFPDQQSRVEVWRIEGQPNLVVKLRKIHGDKQSLLEFAMSRASAKGLFQLLVHQLAKEEGK